MDKICVNLTKSGEGEGSNYSGDQVRSYTNTEQDTYMYLVLQEEGQVSDFAQSFDKKHSASSSHAPKTASMGFNAKKQKQSDTPPPKFQEPWMLLKSYLFHHKLCQLYKSQ